MTEVTRIEPGTCQAKVGEQSLAWRRAGLSKYSGRIDLCGDTASHMVDGVPMCGKHVRWHHKRAGEIVNPHVLSEGS